MNNFHLSYVDYVLFTSMVGFSVVMGVYFGIFRKQNTTADYLQGGKQMKVLPVAMSLVASLLSGIALISVPTEVYLFGIQYVMMVLSFPFVGLIVNAIYLPVFYKLQLASNFEYLELRFNKQVRRVASILYTLTKLITMPLMVYIPAISLSHVTGYEVHLIATLMILVCVSYTSLGGAKAIIWIDTLQFSITLSTLGYVFIVGIINTGGLPSIWEKAKIGGRLDFFVMDPDPTIRTSFWSIVIGKGFLWTASTGIFPNTTNKFLSVPTMKDSKILLGVTMTLFLLAQLVICFSGLIIYAKYFDCDPINAGYLDKPDQIIVHYTVGITSQIPGLSGLFLSGLVGTSLSAVSTCLNAVSGSLYADFVLPHVTVSISDKWAGVVMKTITLILGIICVFVIFILERLGTILQVTFSLMGMTNGPLLGVFTLGMFLPMANQKGVLYGIVGSSLFMMFIVVKNQIHIWNGNIRQIPKPLFTEGCDVISNLTSALNSTIINKTPTILVV